MTVHGKTWSNLCGAQVFTEHKSIRCQIKPTAFPPSQWYICDETVFILQLGAIFAVHKSKMNTSLSIMSNKRQLHSHPSDVTFGIRLGAIFAEHKFLNTFYIKHLLDYLRHLYHLVYILVLYNLFHAVSSELVLSCDSLSFC